MPSILFHRHTPWQAPVRCSTNILASEFLADGWDVAYLEGLVHLGNAFRDTAKARSFRAGPRRDRGALVLTPFALLPHAGRWPLSTAAVARRCYGSLMPSLPAQLARHGFPSPDVIWTAAPGSATLKGRFPKAKLVFQVVDYYPAFAGPAMAAIERHDYALADHVLVIGEALRRHVVEQCGADPAKVTVLGQGVALDAYEGELPRPADLPASGPVAVWVGVLTKGDAGLFEAAAVELAAQGASLVLIGPSAPWAEALCARQGNVTVLGPRDPKAVPAYLAHADLGLMLYDRSRQAVYEGQNPLKLYEYAAAGLPTLSTPHREYDTLHPPVTVVRDEAAVRDGVRTLLAAGDAAREPVRAFVAGRSWRDVYRRARAPIDTLLAAAAP